MRVTWYFDFVSPFAYLQCERLDRLPEGTEIEYRPILFAGLLNHWAHKGPAEIPSKRRFTYRQALWIARRDGISFRAPSAHPFNPLDVLRLAIALDCDGDKIKSIFRFIWSEGCRPDDPDSWNTLLQSLNVRDASSRIASSSIKLALRSNTEEAIALGVFGVPTIACEKELFWGYDMTDMAIAYLRDPLAFEDTEMQRMSKLPVGVERPR
ncbi:MAG: 2-hydroxychromene-2-carboxylate isomerase [Gammaproteobacteria bacterium]|jgi:2-hydroxychromene-2-carboxylate isomerase